MEGEVSSISKLGIVLIALAVLIGLGFGVFQISKSTANKGVGNVQGELDGVSASTYTTYDQKTITGTMATSALADFDGDTACVLIANRAYIDCCNKAGAKAGEDAQTNLASNGSGFTQAYGTDGIPIVWAYSDKDCTKAMQAKTSGGVAQDLAFINYNTIIGSMKSGASAPNGCSAAIAKFGSDSIYMSKIYFDSNCYRCTSTYATGSDGKTITNNVIGNTSKTGRTEYIPSGAKFESYLVKDASNTTMGVVFQQISGN